MGHRPLLPDCLLHGPFTVEQARKAGLRRWHLEGASWLRVGPATYVWSGLVRDPMLDLAAALTRLPPGAAFSGLTAAWLHGLDVPPRDPIEATVTPASGVTVRAGIRIRRIPLGADDVVRLRGFAATSIVRTIGDVSATLSLTEAVVMADAALHLRRVRIEDLRKWASITRRGIRGLRRVLQHVEPLSESPMESRLRMVLVLGGLPRPAAQVPIRDARGKVIGRPDLYYERQRLGIEYDGAVHRTSLAEDNRRQNNLLRAGVRLLRFTGADVLGNPGSIVLQVRQLLNEPASVSRRGLDAAAKSAFVHIYGSS